MAPSKAPDIASKRLSKADYAANFTDLHPPLSPHEALVEGIQLYGEKVIPMVRDMLTSAKPQQAAWAVKN